MQWIRMLGSERQTSISALFERGPWQASASDGTRFSPWARQFTNVRLRPGPLLDPVRLGSRAREHLISLPRRHRLQDRSSIRWSVKVTQACILVEASPFSIVLLSVKVPFPCQGPSPMATGNLRSRTLSAEAVLITFSTTIHRVPQPPRFCTELHLLQVILFLVVVA